MALFQCAVLGISVILLIIGLSFVGGTGYAWYWLMSLFRNLESLDDGLGVVLLPLMFVMVLVTVQAVVQTMSGILGIAAVCQRGQCVIIAFMVFCILTCLSSAEFIAFGAFSMSPIWMDRLSAYTGKRPQYVFFGWIGGFAFIFVLALIGSILSCLAKREYCERQSVQEPERLIIPSSVAPALAQEMQEVTVM